MSEPLMKIISAESVDDKQGRSITLAEDKTDFIISGSGNVQYFSMSNSSGLLSDKFDDVSYYD